MLRTVLAAIEGGELSAGVPFVFCNRDPGEHPGSDTFMAEVRAHGIPLVTLSSQRFRRERGAPTIAAVREEYDREVSALLAGYAPDYCVLAGYGLICSPEMSRRYTMLNLHPALPGGPVGTWQQVIWRLIEDRAAEHGVMVHLATEELDQGPPLAYTSFPIRGEPFDGLWEAVRDLPIDDVKRTQGEDEPLFQAIRSEGVRRERPLLIEALKALAGGRLRVEGRRVLDGGGSPIDALDMNDEVGRALASDATL